MSAFYEEGLKHEELREAFQEAAANGQKNLLVLREIAHNVLQSEARTFTCSVAHQAGIVPTLRRLNRYAHMGIDVELVGVYDLTGDFEYQASYSGAEQIKGILSYPTRAELEAYEQERNPPPAAKPLPWYKRLLG